MALFVDVGTPRITRHCAAERQLIVPRRLESETDLLHLLIYAIVSVAIIESDHWSTISLFSVVSDARM